MKVNIYIIDHYDLCMYNESDKFATTKKLVNQLSA